MNENNVDENGLITPKPGNKLKVVDDGNLGIYVWERPNGKTLASTDGLILNVPAVRGDLTAIGKITSAAAYYGYPDGKAVWKQSHRCSEDEYLEQLDDLKRGEAPAVGVHR